MKNRSTASPGGAALLKHTVKNKYNYTAEQIQLVANELNRELKRYDPKYQKELTVEVPNHMFSAYIYRSLGIELRCRHPKSTAYSGTRLSPAVPTEGSRIFWLTFGKRAYAPE